MLDIEKRDAGRQAQVAGSHYSNRGYLNAVRSITHWHQMNAVVECCPPGGAVLEVGPGTGHATWLMRLMGLRVTTIDIADDLKPDLIGDVTAMEVADDSYDCVIAAEVLEHIPYEDFETALRELARVSRGPVVITLPAPLIGMSLLVNLPLLEPLEISIGLPYWRRHAFNGEHYWELGKRGYGKRRVRRSIRAAGLAIEREYRPAPSLFSYFFVLRPAG